MPTSSSRGAVHILFLIVTLIIALAGWGLWFLQLQDNESLTEQATAAKMEAQGATAKRIFAEGAYQIAAGYTGNLPGEVNYPEDVANTPAKDHYKQWTPKLDLEMEGLRSRIQDPGAKVENLLQAWEPIIARLNATRNEVSQLQTQIVNKNTQIQSLQDQLTAKESAHQSTLEQARQAADRDTSRLTTQLDTIRTENTGISEQIRVKLDEIEATKEQANKELQSHTVAMRTLDGQVQTVKRALQIERERETPDGRVIAVEPTLKTVFIDVGGKDFLRNGTRFKVYRTGKGAVKEHKGWLRVVSVADSRAECRVDESVSGRGIEVGDWIYNPYFNPSVKAADKQHFVFLGEINGRYTREILQSMLESRGAVIDSAVTIDTDFLVVGQSEDPEVADITEDPAYQKAKQWGIEMVRAQDLEPFLRY